MKCDSCGGYNPVWFAPNNLWNLVVDGPEAKDDPGGILCPVCFIKRTEAAGYCPTAWELRPEAEWEELRSALEQVTAERDIMVKMSESWRKFADPQEAFDILALLTENAQQRYHIEQLEARLAL